MFTLNCNGRIFAIDKPVVMGIINITPDSFYAKSRKQTEDEAVEMVAAMLKDGARILDLGAQSTRPGSRRLSEVEEADRLLPILEVVRKSFPESLISIDTYYASVAGQAILNGASIINDISGGVADDNMLATVGKFNIPYICMHMQGVPETMQQSPAYGDVTKEVLDFFIDKIENCRRHNIKDVIIDPGFGFGKTTNHNFQLLRNLSVFKMLDKPIMVGLSRKGMIYKTLNTTADEALNGSTAANMIALMNGANILRVHDVKEAAEVITLFEAYKASKKED